MVYHFCPGFGIIPAYGFMGAVPGGFRPKGLDPGKVEMLAPGKLTIPVNPVIPGNPVIPDIPGIPGIPDIPCIPGIPDIPGGLKAKDDPRGGCCPVLGGCDPIPNLIAPMFEGKVPGRFVEILGGSDPGKPVGGNIPGRLEDIGPCIP